MSQKKTSHEKEIAEIWKLFRETARQAKETDRKIEAMSKETDRKIKALSEETTRQIKVVSEELREIIREMKEENDQRAKETDRQIKALSEETARQKEETERQKKETARQRKETERQKQETDQTIKEDVRRMKYLDNLFSSQWGKLMESLVRGDVIKLLRDQNIEVNRILHDEEIQGTYEERQWEFDIAAVNGKELVIVEVKTTMKKRDVDHFIKKVEKFTTLRPRYKGSRIYGAMAYLKADQSSDIYSEKKGLFVIRATGSSASITNKKGFKPKFFS